MATIAYPSQMSDFYDFNYPMDFHFPVALLHSTAGLNNSINKKDELQSPAISHSKKVPEVQTG